MVDELATVWSVCMGSKGLIHVHVIGYYDWTAHVYHKGMSKGSPCAVLIGFMYSSLGSVCHLTCGVLCTSCRPSPVQDIACASSKNRLFLQRALTPLYISCLALLWPLLLQIYSVLGTLTKDLKGLREMTHVSNWFEQFTDRAGEKRRVNRIGSKVYIFQAPPGTVQLFDLQKVRLPRSFLSVQV